MKIFLVVTMAGSMVPSVKRVLYTVQFFWLIFQVSFQFIIYLNKVVFSRIEKFFKPFPSLKYIQLYGASESFSLHLPYVL